MSERSAAKDEWLTRVLGIRFPEAGAADAASGAELRDRVTDLAPSLRKARELAGSGYEALHARVGEVRALEAAGEHEQALDLMDDIELELAAILPPSNVTFQKLRIRWQKAKQSASAALEGLRKTVEAEVADTELAGNAKRLDDILAHLSVGLGDTLDAFGNAAPGSAERDTLKERARTIARDYVEFLDGSPLVTHVENNPFEPVDVRLALMQPLQLIETELEKGGA